MLWFSEHLHLGDEGRAGAQERARMSVGDLFTPSLGFAEVSRRWPQSATGMKGERERRGGRECQSAICPRQASPDSRTFHDARPSVTRNMNFSN